MDTRFEIAIVGMGIAGLYAGYKFSKHVSLGLFEKNLQTGGRIKTKHLYNSHAYEHGPARFHTTQHPIIKDLLSEFRIETEPYFYRLVDIDEKIKKLSIIMETLFSAYPEEKNISFKQFILNHFNANMLSEIINDSGYHIFFNDDLSLTEVKRIFTESPEINQIFSGQTNSEWMKPESGFSELVKKLTDSLFKNNHEINCAHELISLKHINNQYQLDFIVNGTKKRYFSKKIILALPKNALEKIDCNFDLIYRAIPAITTVPLIKIFLHYPYVWWDSIAKDKNFYLVNSKIHGRAYFSLKENEVMIYCNGIGANEWNRSLTETPNTLTKIFHDFMSKKFNIALNEIPLPSRIDFTYWEHGVSYWNIHQEKYHSAKIQQHENTCFLASDMFSHHSGWIEGALDNVEKIVEIINKNT